MEQPSRASILTARLPYMVPAGDARLFAEPREAQQDWSQQQTQMWSSQAGEAHPTALPCWPGAGSPRSDATRSATLMAAMRRGCVHTMLHAPPPLTSMAASSSI